MFKVNNKKTNFKVFVRHFLSTIKEGSENRGTECDNS